VVEPSGWAASIPEKRFDFICSLHRNGTTLIARTLARHHIISLIFF